MRAQLAMHYPTASGLWSIAPREDSIGSELADGHYSRQTLGAPGFLPPGESFVLVHRGVDGKFAVWGVVLNMFRGALRWRNTIFRNTSSTRSSELIVAATILTMASWRARGAWPSVPLRTEIDVLATAARRSKRSRPGHCYYEAGWTFAREIPRGHGRPIKHELEAPYGGSADDEAA